MYQIKSSWRLVVTAAILTLATAVGAQVNYQVSLTPEAVFTFHEPGQPGLSLEVSQSGQLLNLHSGETLLAEQIRFEYTSGGKFPSSSLRRPRRQVNVEDKTVRVTGSWIDAGMEVIELEEVIRGTPQGLEVTVEFSPTAPVDSMAVFMPLEPYLGKNFLVQHQPRPYPQEKGAQVLYLGPLHEFVFGEQAPLNWAIWPLNGKFDLKLYDGRAVSWVGDVFYANIFFHENAHFLLLPPGAVNRMELPPPTGPGPDYEAAAPPPPPPPPDLVEHTNLIYNSSFELGSYFWAPRLATAPPEVQKWEDMPIIHQGVDNSLDFSTAAHGARSLKLDFPDRHLIESELIHIAPEKTYTLSLQMKSSVAELPVTVSLLSGYKEGGQRPGPVETITVGPEWQRYSLSEVIAKYPKDALFVQILAESGQTGSLWIDAVQLEQGELSEFKPAHPVEATTDVVGQPDRLYFDGEPVNLRTTVSAPGQTDPVEVRYRLLDYYDEEVQSFSRMVTPDLNGRAEVELSLTPDRRGCFHLLTETGEGEQATQAEEIFYAVKRPRVAGPDPDSYFGGHMVNAPYGYELQVAEKIGMKWIRLMDMTRTKFTQWLFVEPGPGDWRWYDQDLARILAHDLTPLGQFFQIPRWAGTAPPEMIGKHGEQRYPPRDLEEYRNYIRHVTEHYGDRITDWEIWNEPNVWCWPGPLEEYGKLTKVAYQAAKEVSPEFTIISNVGLGADGWLEQVGHLGVLDYLDVVSWHYYNQRAIEDTDIFLQRLRDFREAFGQYRDAPVPMWDTESGVGCPTFYRHEYPGRAGEGSWPTPTYPQGVNALVRLMTMHVAEGIEKYFYYFVAANRYYSSRSLPTDMMDLGATPKPIAVAFSTAASNLDGAHAAGRVFLGDYGYAFVFEREGQTLVAAWAAAAGDNYVECSFTLPGVEFTRVDVMNNEHPFPAVEGRYTLRLTSEPVMLWTSQAAPEQVLTALQAAQVAEHF